MNIAIDEHFERFIEEQVKSGRFQSAEEVVLEGLRLFESLQSRIQVLRERFVAALDEGDCYTDDEVATFLAADDGGPDYFTDREAKLQVLREYLKTTRGTDAVYTDEDLDELLRRGEFSCLDL